MRLGKLFIVATCAWLMILPLSKIKTEENLAINEVKIQEVKIVHRVEEKRIPLTYTIPAKEIVIEKWYDIKVTFYTNSIADCGNTKGIGASGIKLNRGHVAMPKNFKFGTQMFIEGIGVVENQDHGSAVKMLPDGTIVVDVYIPNVGDNYIKQLGVIYTRGKIINNIQKPIDYDKLP